MAASETPQLIVLGGLEPVLAAADAAGHEFANRGNQFIQWENTSGANRTITVVTTRTIGPTGLPVNDLTKTIATGKRDLIGALTPSDYNDANGNVGYSFDNAGGVTTGVFTLKAVS